MRIRNPLPKKNRELVLNRDGRRCAYCGNGDRLEVDHVIPIKHNGTDLMSNLITSCKTCNISKNRHRLLPVFEKQALEWVRVANELNGIDGDMDASNGWNRIKHNGNYRIYEKLTKEEKAIYASSRPTGKQKKRTVSIENRISLECPLYYLVVNDVDELRRARRGCLTRKCEFMAIATGIEERKLFFTTMKIKHSASIDPVLARKMVFECSKSISRSKISGRMGLSVC